MEECLKQKCHLYDLEMAKVVSEHHEANCTFIFEYV